MVRRGSLLALSALVGLGCNAILGIDHGQPKPAAVDSGVPDATVPDASFDDGPDLDASDATPADASNTDVVVDPLCPIRAPSAPSRDDDPGGSRNVAFEVAAETLQLDVAPELGLDLDSRCSCRPDPPSCTARMGRPDLQCDEPGGRDVMANKFLQSWVALGETALSQDSLRGDLAYGRAGTLIRVHNYNGLANDKFVIVEFFGKAWIPPVGGIDQPTQLDGTDVWSVYSDSIVGASTAIEQDIAGFVNDHVLVAKLLTATFALRPHTGANDNPLVVELHDAVLTGTLVPSDRGFRIDAGQVTGRWPAHRALLALGALADSNGFLCGNHPFYGTLHQQVCDNLDIVSARADDNSGAACDAMSLALGFSAGPAHIGPAKDPNIVAGNCPPGWTPTCNGP